MAPEQYLGEALDRRVDIFAAGVLLYQLLTGRMPFTGSSESVMYQVLNEQPVPPSEAAPVAAVFDGLVAQALAKSLDERFLTAAAFQRALLYCGASATGSDETVILSARPAATLAAAAFARSAAQARDPAPPITAPATTASTTLAGLVATGWDASELKRIERALATQVGPLARVMVLRTARQCRDAVELTTRLAEELSTADERAAFLATAGAVSGTAPIDAARGDDAAPDARDTASGPLADAVVEQALKILTHHIGPIARLLVKKAAQQGGSRAQFFARLAAHVDRQDERTQLMAELERIG
jgi:serine/threonine-protein kinase